VARGPFLKDGPLTRLNKPSASPPDLTSRAYYKLIGIVALYFASYILVDTDIYIVRVCKTFICFLKELAIAGIFEY
jgi:hypothetical protein